jgi:hypothetical protein
MDLFDIVAGGKTAARPLYEGARQRDYRIAKFIITDDGREFYLLWADTGNMLTREEAGVPEHKCRGYEDWEELHIALERWRAENGLRRS